MHTNPLERLRLSAVLQASWPCRPQSWYNVTDVIYRQPLVHNPLISIPASVWTINQYAHYYKSVLLLSIANDGARLDLMYHLLGLFTFHFVALSRWINLVRGTVGGCNYIGEHLILFVLCADPICFSTRSKQWVRTLHKRGLRESHQQQWPSCKYISFAHYIFHFIERDATNPLDAIIFLIKHTTIMFFRTTYGSLYFHGLT